MLNKSFKLFQPLWPLQSVFYMLMAVIPFYLSIVTPPGPTRAVYSAFAVLIMFTGLPLCIKLCNLNMILRKQPVFKGIVIDKTYNLSKIIIKVKINEDICEIATANRRYANEFADGSTVYLSLFGAWALQVREQDAKVTSTSK